MIMLGGARLKDRDQHGMTGRKKRITHDYRITPETTVVNRHGLLTLPKTYRKNILLMNLSLFTGFLFFPFGTSVHI